MFLISCGNSSNKPIPQNKRLPFQKLQLENGKCSLHKTELVLERLRIVYGLMEFNKSFIEAKEQHFPNYLPYIMGGCMVNEEADGTIQICTECKKEYLKYSNKKK